MNKQVFFLLFVGFSLFMLSCNSDSDSLDSGEKGNYHNDDKEGLRVFLRQPSGEAGKINAEWFGLQMSDTLDWYKNEAWVNIITGLTWNDESPKRLIEIKWSGLLAGTLDASNWIALKKLDVPATPINALELRKNTELEYLRFSCDMSTLDVSKNTKLRELSFLCNLTDLDLKSNTALTRLECTSDNMTTLDLRSNTALTYLVCDAPLTALDVRANTALNTLGVNCQFTEIDVSMNTELEIFECKNMQFTQFDLSKNTKLKRFYCTGNNLTSLEVNSNQLEWIECHFNHLPLSNLLVFSEMITGTEDDWHNKELGPQYLLPQTVNTGSEIDYSDQSIFKGIKTQFEVRTGGADNPIDPLGIGDPAPESDYTLIDGRIKFNRKGIYWVIMSNEAITSSRFTYPKPAEVYAEINVL